MTCLKFTIGLWFAGTAVLCTGSIAATDRDAVGLLGIPSVLKQLDAEADELKMDLEQLPTLAEPMLLDAYGYHGGYLQALAHLPDEPRWVVDIEFEENVRLQQMILVPSIDRRFDRPESFGFPRRFRVIRVMPDGSFSTVEEWMDEDCPDPGRMPLVVNFEWAKTALYRIEVFRGAVEGDREFFALDEIFGVLDHAVYRPEKITANSEYVSRPYWDISYLNDQKTSMGLPLGVGETKKETDFSVIFDNEVPAECYLELEMGSVCTLGWVSFYPAQPPSGNIIPGYGFPEHLRTVAMPPEWTSTVGLGKWNWLPYDWDSGNPGNNVVRMPGANRKGDRFRIQIKKLPVHNGRPTFALGEILIHRRGDVFPIHSIQLVGFPEGADEKVHLLMDGMADGKPVLFLWDWLERIERRNQLSRSLDELSSLRDGLEQRWRQFWVRSGMVLAVLAVVLALFAAVFSRIQRIRHARALRRQISSDLHDDLGSKLATISLTSEMVAMTAKNPDIHEGCRSISDVSKEINNALRDVLWVTDSRTDSLNQLILQLGQIAEKAISPERLSLQLPDPQSIPKKMLNIRTKRDIVLFYREVLHNVLSHAQASEVTINVVAEKKKLKLTVADNGVGFQFDSGGDTLFRRNHYGLASMKERADRLHARYCLKSRPGAGTRVELEVPV